MSERHSVVPPPVPSSSLEQRVARLEGTVHEALAQYGDVLARLQDEHVVRTRLAKVAYVFGGVFAGALGEAIRGAIAAAPSAEHVVRVLFGW